MSTNAATSSYKVVSTDNVRLPNQIGAYFRHCSWWEIAGTLPLHVVLGLVAGGTLGTVAGYFCDEEGDLRKWTLIGAVGGLYWNGLYHKEKYEEWLQLYKESIVFEEFFRLHLDSPLLQEFLDRFDPDIEAFVDPIHATLMLNPVRSPYGHVYEESTLKRMRRDDGTIKDPFNNPDFRWDDVQPAPDVMAKLKATYCKLLTQELHRELHPDVKKGIEVLIEELDNQIDAYLQKITIDCMMTRKLQPELYKQKVKKLMEFYSIISEFDFPSPEQIP